MIILKDMGEISQLVAVKQDAYYIKHIENPSEKVQMAAVSQDGFAIEYITNPSEDIQLAAVVQDGCAIQFLENPSERVKLAAVSQYGMAIQYIKNPSEEVQMAAVSQDVYSIRYIKNVSEEIQLTAVNQNGYAIQYIKNPSEEIQMKAVSQYGLTIEFIKNPSEEVQIAAVSQDAYSIRYINNPSEEVQMIAVMEHEILVQYLESPSERVQLAALKHDECKSHPSQEAQLQTKPENSHITQCRKDPLGDNISSIEYITHMGNDLTVANSARVSMSKHHDEFQESDKNLLNYLAKNNHWTPFSQCQVQFRIKMPIFLARQWFKHQIGVTRNEVSRRYVKDNIEFYIPKQWRLKADNVKQGSSEDINIDSQNISADINILCNHIHSLYNELTTEGEISPEMARMILPQNTYTEFIETGSLAAYARIIKQRTNPHAQKEIQTYGVAIQQILDELFPNSMKALREEY